MLSNYFTSVFNASAEDDPITNNNSDINDETGSAPLTNLERSLPNFDINTEDVLKAINDLKTNKSPGPDNIYPIILKETKTR